MIPTSEDQWISTRGLTRGCNQKHLCAPVSYADVGLFKHWLAASTTIGNARTERDALICKMAQWLQENDKAYYGSHLVDDVHSAIGDILDIIVNLLGMLKTPTNLLAVILLYADRFVKRSGIKHNQLFNLLLTSSVVTVKFWNESVVVSNKNMAQLFEFSLADLNLMEHRFLLGVDYVLCLSENDVKVFLKTIESEYQNYQIKRATQQILGAYDTKSKVFTSSSKIGVRADNKMVDSKKGPASPSIIMSESLSSVSISVAAAAQ